MMDGAAFQDVYNDEMKEAYVAQAAKYDGALNSGKTVRLLPGESITSPTPGRPNPQFEGFFGAMLNMISIALNMPKEVLTKAFNASYSASRAALLDAYHTWKIERVWFVSNWSQPIYEEWLADAVALGIIVAPGFFSDPFVREAWCGSNWGGDGPGALDPLKEALAAEKRMEVGITTQAEETVAYDGGDWEEKTHQRSREVRLRRESGLMLEAQPVATQPDPVDPVDPVDPLEEDDKEEDGSMLDQSATVRS
jgi:hypothetical protein